MSFGKPGRPREDRLLRQREIYEAVAPLILTEGARRLQMRDAAHAACLSVGGLYHYFPTKRELVLHGLNTEAQRRFCDESMERVARAGFSTFVDACVDTTLRIITFMRPSVVAARDLGGETLETALNPDWIQDTGALVANFQSLWPDVPTGDLAAMARLIRRVMIGALTEREVDLDVVRDDLYRMIEAQTGAAGGRSAA